MRHTINLAALLPLINLDTSSFPRGGNTLGDSAVGEFIDPLRNVKFIIKKSKKEDNTRAANQANNEPEIINDILTEYFIGLIGAQFSSIQTCRYTLAKFNGTLRIASENFLQDNQAIFHGRELFEDFYDLEQLEDPRNKKYPSIYLLFNIEKHLKIWISKQSKPNIFQDIFDSFLKMCFWDAIIGNNDRHLQNWGIITSLDSGHIPIFTPIYDTARAFKWNALDNKLTLNSVEAYSKNSCPHVGIRIGDKINHFEFIRKILIFYPKAIPMFTDLLNEAEQIEISATIQNDAILHQFFSQARKDFISSCFNFRITELRNIINQVRSTHPCKNKMEFLFESLVFWIRNKFNRAVTYPTPQGH